MTSLGFLLLVGSEWDRAVGIIEEGEARALPPSVVATPDFLDVAGAHGWIQLDNKPTFFLNGLKEAKEAKGCIRPLVIRAQVEPVFPQSFEFDLREPHIILRVLTQALNPSIGECDLELTCFGVL